MDNVYEALDEAKAEIEKLKSENRRKEELCVSLKKSQHEQLDKIQEASSRVEKQAQELVEKEGEISVTKLICDDLKSSLNEKDSIIKQLRIANDKLRDDCHGKSRKLEEEHKALVLALEEANAKNIDQEQKICSFREEIEGLKGILAVSQKKFAEAEQKFKMAKEGRDGDHTLLDLEEENRRIEDELKWKKEQFKHLEEAHEKLREQFRTSEKEWQKEKCSLLDQISSLQTNLDSQTRVSEDLQKRFEMCHQALAHEESRRKRLEVQLSEFQTRFEKTLECQDAEFEVAGQREDEIGSLRSSLGRKDMLCKDMEYQVQKLEQENQELLKSLKDLHEAQIHESSAKSSTAKLRVKLKAMEQKYQDCSKNLRTKEAEWNSQLKEVKSELESKDRAMEALMAKLEGCNSLITQLKLQQSKESEQSSELENLRKDFNDCRSEIEHKDQLIEKLKMESEACNSVILQLKMQNQDWSSQLENAKRDLNACRSELASKDRAIEELSEQSSELENLRKDLNDCRSEIEHKDLHIEKLKMESEVCKMQNQEWSSQLENAKRDFNACKSELASKDRAIEELNLELEACNSLLMQLKMEQHPKESEQSSQLENLRKDLDDCRSEMEHKDADIEKLKMELEACDSVTMQLKVQNQDLSSQLEKERRDFNACRSELASKDRAMEELNLEMEACNSVMTRLKVQSQDWSSQLENTKLEGRSELASKDRAIEVMMVELEGCKSLMAQLKLQIQDSESQAEKMSKDFNDCRSESESKDRVIEELLMELEDHHSETIELMLQNEEMSVMLMLLKSGISEAQLNFIDKDQERDKKVEALLMRIETLAHIEEKQLVMKKELKRYKGMVTEMSSALERANSELVEKICEGNQMEFELQIWKSFAECLKANLEEHYAMRKELEGSLLAQMEMEEILKHEKNGLVLVLDEKDRRIDSLRKQIVVLDEELKTRQTEAASSESTTKENKIIEDLQKQIGLLEQESIRRELEGALLAQITAEKIFDHDKQNLIQLVNEKNQRINNLDHLVTSLEENLSSASVSFSAQLSEKQEEINMVSEALEKIKSAEVLAELEIEEKKLMIVELEDELETMEKKMGNSGSSIDELRREKQNLVDDITSLLSERENLSCFLGEMDVKIDTLSHEDEQLMQSLGRIVQSFSTDAERVDEKENIITRSSPLAKSIEVTLEGRSPFREVNS